MSEVKDYPPYMDYPKPRKAETNADCISRKALLARYDAEHVGPPGKAKELIATAPAADVAEVVRCKDCKWYSELVCGEGELLGSQGWCNEVMARPMPSNGFCSFGERKTDG